MVKYSGKTLIIFLLLTMVKLSQVHPQELGNPISNLKTNEFSMSLYGEVIWRELNGADYNAYRGVTKTEFGFFDRLKIFALFGVDKMLIKNPIESRLTDYDGKSEIAFGGGFQAELLKIKRTSFFTGGGIYRTFSNGSVINEVLEEEIEIDMRFDWQEYWFAFGTSLKTKRFEIYGGLEERTLERMEKITETEYVSGLKPNLFFGIDFLFPKNFILNFQVKALDQNAICFGISQRSIGDLK